MVMALGTLCSNPHEDLSDVLRHLQSILLDLIEVCRRVLECPSGGCEQLSNNLIERSVRCDLIDQSVVVQVRCLVGNLVVALDHQ